MIPAPPNVCPAMGPLLLKPFDPTPETGFPLASVAPVVEPLPFVPFVGLPEASVPFGVAEGVCDEVVVGVLVSCEQPNTDPSVPLAHGVLPGWTTSSIASASYTIR